MTDCVFCKIIAGQIPSSKVYEDDDVYVFNDIRPVAPVHLLIVPKQHIESLAHTDDSHQQVLGKMLRLAAELAKQQGLGAGFKTSINTGKAGGQEVFHLHVHVYGTPA